MHLAIQTDYPFLIIPPKGYPTQDVCCNWGIEQDFNDRSSSMPMDPACKFLGDVVTHLNPRGDGILLGALRYQPAPE